MSSRLRGRTSASWTRTVGPASDATRSASSTSRVTCFPGSRNLEIAPGSRAPAPWLAEVRRTLGIDEFHDTEINKLSGGQRRRVCILRALQMEAKVLLLDEPTTGLDDHLASCVRRALRDLADRGCAVVVATHEEAISAAADRAIALRGRRTIL